MAVVLALHCVGLGLGRTPHEYVGQGTIESLRYVEKETQHLGGGFLGPSVMLQLTCTTGNTNIRLKYIIKIATNNCHCLKMYLHTILDQWRRLPLESGSKQANILLKAAFLSYEKCHIYCIKSQNISLLPSILSYRFQLLI